MKPKRFPLPPFTKGLSTLVDPGAGDPAASPDLKDVRGHTGVLACRTGYRILDIEPSWNPSSGSSGAPYLGFDGVNDYAYNSSWTQTLGTKWTIRLHAAALSLSSVNQTDGTRTLLQIKATTYDPVVVAIIGVTSAGTGQLRATIKDSAGTTATLTGTARTTTQWTTLLGNWDPSKIRIVRDGASVSMYVGGTLEASTTSFSTVAHEVATGIYCSASSTPANYSYSQFQDILVVNRALTEAETYWGIGYPLDVEAEQDVLGCWLFYEGTGTTVKDFSAYAKNLTISGATWNSSQCQFFNARGLGIRSWRRSNGDIYHVLACSRRGSAAASTPATGAVYTWKATDAFTPFYFGGTSANTNATAGLTGLNLFARVDFAQGRDMLLLSNGRDHNRKYQSAFAYMSGTAPATAPVLSTGTTGLTGTFRYAYSYFNSTTKTETGLSPDAVVSPSNKTVTINWFTTADSQFDRVRIYRTQSGETALYLLTEQAMAAGSYADTKSDADLRAGPLCPGSDLPGNRNRKRAFHAYPSFSDGDGISAPSTSNRYSYRATGQRLAPTSAPTLAESGTASVDAGVHYFAYSYYDSTNEVETGMSPATAITATGAKQVDISALVLPPEGSRYDKMRIYRTKAGAWLWYLAQTITAATTATETQADSALSTTVETYALPPKFEGMCVFANRLWGFVGPTLHWSTNGYFEDHPEGNGFAPKAGVRITAVNATQGSLFVHFEDGTIHRLPHPGDEPDLSYFVPLNLREWSPIGAAVGHFTAQAVPGGLIWLARDGFYLADDAALTPISRQIAPSFLNLNGARGRYACSLYDFASRTYRCWASRGNSRLNDECFVYYLDDGSWWLDSIHADAAGVLYDAKENPHFCFLVENGVLCELDETLDYDGDGGGTTFGTVTTPYLNSLTAIGGRTAPTGGDGGYSIWFVKSDGTMLQRYAADPVMDPRGDVDGYDYFYPSASDIASGSWTAYYHGIRGYFKTMLLHLGDVRMPKNIHAIFFANRVQSAGGLQVNLARDEGTLTAVNGDVDLTVPLSQVTPAHGSGRAFQLEIYSDPPRMNRPWALKAVEIEATVDGSDVGT